MLIADVNKRLADKELKVELTPEAKEFVVSHGFDPTYGARPLKRYIQKTVETLAAKLILAGNISTGTILIDVDGDKLEIIKIQQQPNSGVSTDFGVYV